MLVRKRKILLIGLVLMAVVALGAACGSGSGGLEEGGPQTSGLLSASSSFPGTVGLSTSSLQSSGTLVQGGISVTGTGTVTVSPDVAILVLGVEARRDTVAQAREDAAGAMEGIVQVLEANGIAEKDIKTQSLSIQPLYNFRTETPQLEGFRVTNIVRVKIRDLENVGGIIDQVVEAGGDLTRIQSIGFSVDDPAPLQAGMRALAVEDALAKAQQLAVLTGVALGRPISIVEGGGGAPVFDTVVRSLAVAEASSVPTSISPGEIEMSLNVSIIFAIE
ncbi:MAG: SIMPL domain-containing protein [Chloroflexi bacterium]|nr:SIMPL domain-containing protein [Chloroflexota bacterium]